MQEVTEETPFSLVYGTKALIPVEIEYLSPRNQVFEPESNETGLRSNLDFLEEKRERAEFRRKVFQERVAKTSNAKVKLKNIVVGDLVLTQTKLGSRTPEGGAFGQNLEGLFRVIEE